MLCMLMLGKLLAALLISSELRPGKAAFWQIVQKRQSAAQAREFTAGVAALKKRSSKVLDKREGIMPLMPG